MTFWYLASPYSRYPGGLDEANRVACEAAAMLVKAGVPVFSPIAHSHSIARLGGVDPLSHAVWLPADEPFMDAACGCIVLMAEGWDSSVGVTHEINRFTRAGKPVVAMLPGQLCELPEVE